MTPLCHHRFCIFKKPNPSTDSLMNYSQLITYIDQQAKTFHSTEEEWEYEEIEQDVIRKIFHYCVANEIKFEGFNLETLLNAEDDEGLAGNRHEMMFDLMRRISGDSVEGVVEAREEVEKLFEHYHKKFYPDFF